MKNFVKKIAQVAMILLVVYSLQSCSVLTAIAEDPYVQQDYMRMYRDVYGFDPTDWAK